MPLQDAPVTKKYIKLEKQKNSFNTLVLWTDGLMNDFGKVIYYTM